MLMDRQLGWTRAKGFFYLGDGSSLCLWDIPKDAKDILLVRVHGEKKWKEITPDQAKQLAEEGKIYLEPMKGFKIKSTDKKG